MRWPLHLRGHHLRGRLVRRLASERVQRWALALPLTRPVARRRARQLFAMASGFVQSQWLVACVETGLLEALRESDRSGGELAVDLGITAHSLTALLSAASALGLVTRHDDQVGLGQLGAALLGNPAALAMIGHHGALYRDLADPGSLLGRPRPGDARPPRVAQLWSYAGANCPEQLPPDRVATYSALMTRSQTMIADQVLGAVSLARHRLLLDLGGGEGQFAVAAVMRNPGLQALVFDLPAVCQAARRRIDDSGLGDRIGVVPGTFHSDQLPPGADVISVVRVLHDHDDAIALRILRGARAALPPGGKVVVAEPMAGPEPLVDAYFAAYFLSMGQGRLRSAAEIEELLGEAGFAGVRREPTRLPLVVSVVTGVAAE